MSNAFPTDFQFKLACDNAVVASTNYQWGWKGEWWGYAGTSIYSHTQTPNRTSCQYFDFSSSPIGQGLVAAEDVRGTITSVSPEFQAKIDLSPREVGCYTSRGAE